MIRVDVKDLKGDEILAVPVMSASDTVLVQSDTELKEEYIQKLGADYSKKLVAMQAIADAEDLVVTDEELKEKKKSRSKRKYTGWMKRQTVQGKLSRGFLTDIFINIIRI